MSRYDWPRDTGGEERDDPGGARGASWRAGGPSSTPKARCASAARRGRRPVAPAARRRRSRRPAGASTCGSRSARSAVLGGQADGEPRVSGRVNALAVHPDGQRVYAASANGGVWYSRRRRRNWISVGGPGVDEHGRHRAPGAAQRLRRDPRRVRRRRGDDDRSSSAPARSTYTPDAASPALRRRHRHPGGDGRRRRRRPVGARGAQPRRRRRLPHRARAGRHHRDCRHAQRPVSAPRGAGADVHLGATHVARPSTRWRPSAPTCCGRPPTARRPARLWVWVDARHERRPVGARRRGRQLRQGGGGWRVALRLHARPGGSRGLHARRRRCGCSTTAATAPARRCSGSPIR